MGIITILIFEILRDRQYCSFNLRNDKLVIKIEDPQLNW